ncbi:hypothetical protein BCR42DRAFT_150415 [Absidia repens]|uniref:Uncharacterized protein n=1 Tax=Absidia repens TaxID=90262 RepID=A0A1X2I3D8_9FUNG|nr:hypothetical protein BCR42DRAFT_150415 [Absidia repens]
MTVTFYRCMAFYLQTLPESSCILLTPLKSSAYEHGFYLKTLSESSRFLLTPHKTSTDECDLHTKTLSESSLKLLQHYSICHHTIHYTL